MVADPSTEARLRLIYPDLAVRFRRLKCDMSEHYGLQIRIAQGLRTYAQQDAIWQEGRKQDSSGAWVISHPAQIVTYARPGFSWHNFGAAIDICFMGSDPFLSEWALSKSLPVWDNLARLGMAHGLLSGFYWQSPRQDKPHMELAYGVSLEDARAAYKLARLAGVWSLFDQKRGAARGSDWASVTTRSRLLDPKIPV